MARVVLPYVNSYRVGRLTYWYYRRGRYRVRLRGAPGSSEFLAAYRAAHDGCPEQPKPDRPAAGTLAELVQRYKAGPEWHELRVSTQADYDKSIGPLVAAIGHVQVAEITRADIAAIRTERATRDTPRGPVPSPTRANKTVTVLSVLLGYAVETGYRADNPALRPRRLRTGGGYRPWTDDEITRFRERVPEMRLPLLLALATGQRSSDLVRMTWRAYDGQAIEVTQVKTGAAVWIPCHPELRAALDAVQTRFAVTILVQPGGAPWSVSQFQTAASKAIRSAGLRGLVWHGLRHTAASWMADAGCSDREIMAITGHRSSAMVSRYVSKAGQRERATGAMVKLARRRIERAID